MLGEGWHGLLPWFSSAFPTEWDICLEKVKLSLHSHLVLCPAHLPVPVLTSVSRRMKCEQSLTAPTLKSGKGHPARQWYLPGILGKLRRAAVFPVHYNLYSLKALARPGTTLLHSSTLQANVSSGSKR